MRKLLFILLAAVTMITANAQKRDISAKDTNTNVSATVISYVNYNSVASKVKAFQASVTKVSGTVAGKVYLEATVDGSQWQKLDSLVLSDVAAQTKLFSISATYYNSYRANFTTTGTQVSYLIFSVLRRPDE